MKTDLLLFSCVFVVNCFCFSGCCCCCFHFLLLMFALADFRHKFSQIHLLI